MDEKRQKLSKVLLETGAVKFGDFLLTSGKRSSYYVDIKNTATDPATLSLIADMFTGMLKGKKIAGVELGAVPLLVATALKAGIPYVIIRKERKHGTGKLTIGEFGEEDIDIIEDVVTTGNSILKAVNYLRENGARVSRAFCVVDREEGGKELLRENGVDLRSILTISELGSR
ncbi:MAG: orotate phosphoribosyltransferase [Candidatus Thermoplasmatota archaeon]|jgi:orotate phosphoribosyltransferase|nr:orotate phosphoribosyltransferase [Candidatus Thermoplasmatota archaeon]MCL6091227.1 orotate phosphoribosyltransferase [Candidatus Thermoplasmatota archaeon]MDA8143750.1 orotate phosphoribosyltransferase [Thermoplasmatales archaeon]